MIATYKTPMHCAQDHIQLTPPVTLKRKLTLKSKPIRQLIIPQETFITIYMQPVGKFDLTVGLTVKINDNGRRKGQILQPH